MTLPPGIRAIAHPTGQITIHLDDRAHIGITLERVDAIRLRDLLTEKLKP